jgi:hypothetical protein
MAELVGIQHRLYGPAPVAFDYSGPGGMGKGASAAAQRQAEESVYVGQEKGFVAQIAEFVRRQATSMADMAPATVSVKLD